MLGSLPVDGAGTGSHDGVVMLRPEQLRLLPADAADGVPGEVVGGDYFGHDALVRVRVAGADAGGPLVVQVRTLGVIPARGSVRVGVTGPARFYPTPASLCRHGLALLGRRAGERRTHRHADVRETRAPSFWTITRWRPTVQG